MNVRAIIFFFLFGTFISKSQSGFEACPKWAVGGGMAAFFDPIDYVVNLKNPGQHYYSGNYTPFNLNLRYRLNEKWSVRSLYDFNYAKNWKPYNSFSLKAGAERNIYISKQGRLSKLSRWYFAADAGCFYWGNPGPMRYERAVIVGLWSGYDYHFNKHFSIRTELGVNYGRFRVLYSRAVYNSTSGVLEYFNYRKTEYSFHFSRFLSVEFNYNF